MKDGKAPDLNRLRQEITALDRQLLDLLAKRRQISLAVAQTKLISERPVRDEGREQALLAELIGVGRELGLDPHYITQLYHTIIEDSVRCQQAWLQQQANGDTRQQRKRVAFLGGKGTYSQLATHKYFARYQQPPLEIGCSSFQGIIEQVESGQADFGVLPIENTTSGCINEVYDLLMHTSLAVVGEITHPIDHRLLCAMDTSLEQIHTIYAHVQPATQCSAFLDTLPKVRIEYTDSSAQALEKVRDLNSPEVAAIGSPASCELYGLKILRKDVANQAQNFSRFIVVSRKPVKLAAGIPAKTSLIMALEQKPGSLVEALLVLREHGLNMCKLESRPMPGNPWEELFYIDVEANVDQAQMQSALEKLQQDSRYLRVLGCYPSEAFTPVEPSV